jgi:hypothetical protein
MIPVLAYWLFLFAFFLSAGVLLKKALQLTSGLPITVLLGMFLSAITFSITAFFFPLGWVSLAIHTVIFAIAAIVYKTELRLQLSSFWKELRSLTAFHKVVLLVLIGGAALRSARSPFVIDNESYYVQTIKWLNEYGFVKGLGNLHLFFGQTSGWHVLQAGLNFSFFTEKINDINGFLFVICTAYYFTEGAKRPRSHWLAFMPVFSILLFMFVDSPSPDLPLLMVTPIVLYLYTENSDGNDNFRPAFLLFAFLVFIKVTIAPVGILFLLWPNAGKHIGFAFTITAIAGGIWIAKNLILTGYPLYPLLPFTPGFEWTVPETILKGMHGMSNQSVYHAKASASFTQKLVHWITAGGLDGIMNKLIVVLFLIMPFFKKIRQEKKWRVIYCCFLIHFGILLCTTPQFRLFLPEILFFLIFIISEILNYFKASGILYKVSIGTACALAILSLFINTGNSLLTDNKFHQDTPGFALRQLYLPEPNTRFSRMEFVWQKEGRLDYYSPKENFFYYGTANGPLPCVNTVQLKGQQKRFGYVPQPLGESLGEGFYSAEMAIE